AGALVQESAPDQISDTANVTVNAGATLDLNDQDDSIGGLLLQGGAVTTGAATLTLGGDVTVTDPGNSDFSSISGKLDLGGATRTFTVADGSAAVDLTISAVISGSGAGLFVAGGGTAELSAANTFDGMTTVSDDGTTLRVDGSVGPVQVLSGAAVCGKGTVGDVTITAGNIDPGDGPGVMTTGSLTLDGDSTFVAELKGSAPGDGITGHDQVVAAGPSVLGGTSLAAAVGGGYAPTPGDPLTIVKNNSGSDVTGTFAGFGDGTEHIISGYAFRIRYQGGASNEDV